jgi:hypothetical protein
MGIVRFGGVLVTTKKDGHFVKTMQVDESTLQKVADALGIAKSDFDAITPEFTSIVIYRGDPRNNRK